MLELLRRVLRMRLLLLHLRTILRRRAVLRRTILQRRVAVGKFARAPMKAAAKPPLLARRFLSWLEVTGSREPE